MKITLNKIYISKRVIANGGISDTIESPMFLNQARVCRDSKCNHKSCKNHGDLDIPEAQLTAANKKLSDRFSEKFKE